MAETYIVGETKVRPGAYFNIQKTGNNAAASIISGVTAVIYKSDFGPLNQAVELNAEDDMQILSELAAQQTYAGSYQRRCKDNHCL